MPSSTKPAPKSKGGAVRIPAIMSVKEAARVLRWTENSMRIKVRNGEIRGSRVGQKVMVSGESVAEVLRAVGITVIVEDVTLDSLGGRA